MIRPARLRSKKNLREALADVRLHPSKLIQPLFVRHGKNHILPISSMPGQFQFSVDRLPEKVETLLEKGLKHILLFGIPEKKDALGSGSFDENGIIQQALKALSPYQKDLTLITDVCFCEYTTHGHCGKIRTEKDTSIQLDMEETRSLLAKQAVSHAQAGSHVIAPSGMIDGMVSAIRQALDKNGYTHLPILSYAVKYASAFYGPFRQAAEGSPQIGDRKSYQADYRRRQEGLLEAQLDIQEGADMLMVKPAGYYLDMVAKIKEAYPTIPLFAYQVSGEYSMLLKSISEGLLPSEVIQESLLSIHRAGADCIISYFTESLLESLSHA